MSKKSTTKLAAKMMLALLFGLICGVAMIALRENLNANGNAELWNQINSLLFADITAQGNESALGIFYILGQLFIRGLQVVIIPMVFTSIVLAMIQITDTKKLGRISSKTLICFLFTTTVALILAAIAGYVTYQMGFFSNTSLAGLETSTSTTGSNPLNILLEAMPNNVTSAFSNNSGVLAVLVMAIGIGLAMNSSKKKMETFQKLCEEISDIITIILGFIIHKFGPLAIFVLITRTFAVYGINYLKPALAYVILTVVLLLVVLIFGYALFVWIAAEAVCQEGQQGSPVWLFYLFKCSDVAFEFENGNEGAGRS